MYVAMAFIHGTHNEQSSINKIFEGYPDLQEAKLNFLAEPCRDGFLVLRKYLRDNPAACEKILDSQVTLTVQDLIDRIISLPWKPDVTSVTGNGNTVVQVSGSNIKIG